MSGRRQALLLTLVAIPLTTPTRATAEGACLECRAVNIQFTVDEMTPPMGMVNPPPQIVVWLETPSGEYVSTSVDGAPLFITQQTGTFGMGNRPGRMDFNSGPLWPYGRREATFPIWSHRHAAKFGDFPKVVFQSGTEDDLSHPMNKSSAEQHYCRPLKNTGGDKAFWDAGTCASQSYTDKGYLSPSLRSNYPPRADIARMQEDSFDIDMYGVLNQFDAVSQATPTPGTPTTITWPIPADFASGDYVLWIEISKEFDYNANYNESNFPSPTIPYGDYGLPYRGQPSVVYKLPFTVVAGMPMTRRAIDFAGYGDPDGLDGDLRAPDATISTDVPGSGGARLKLEADAVGPYRVRIDAQNEQDCLLPSAPADMAYVDTTGRTSTFTFTAPGDDGLVGTASSYEIRYRVGADITEADFEQANKLETSVPVQAAGTEVMVQMDTLLPQTDYVVAVRALDNCHNVGPIAVLRFTTPERKIGEVDACFVATAAYGSLMANDVALLRHFRDSVMRNSVIGELVVESYYTFGPAVAGVVGESDLLRATARGVLAPVIGWVKAF
ncbi:MAG: fibronectin type III domain-containing protein [Proteobacteria bacterium]|nr:fibronectin type III domain-containing protein [Pseudomonadota bacterium]